MARGLPNAANAQAPISKYGTRSRRKQATIRSKTAAMLPSKIPFTLFLPLCYSACVGGDEARQQQPPVFLYLVLTSSRMAISNGLPEPTERCFGQLYTLAEPFLSRAGESDGFHLRFHEVEPPKPVGNFLGSLHCVLSCLSQLERIVAWTLLPSLPPAPPMVQGVQKFKVQRVQGFCFVSSSNSSPNDL